MPRERRFAGCVRLPNVVDEHPGQTVVSDEALDEKTLKLLNNTIADVTAEMEVGSPDASGSPSSTSSAGTY